MPIDYETLRVIWWLLLGVLLVGFAVMDGFDLGAACLLPFVAHTDTERRLVINAVGPTWEGNQVWFILGGGAIFAAWPMLYATSFSGFYTAMLLVLLALILRPVGFKYRSKLEDERWRSIWDYCLFISGVVPAIVFGVAIGNVLQGVPFEISSDLLPMYSGTFLALLNPFALLCGILSLSMMVMHGGNFLSTKLDSAVALRSANMARMASIVTIVLFAAGGFIIAYKITGYSLAKPMDHAGPSNPLMKSVMTSNGLWLHGYLNHPWIVMAPILGFLGALLSLRFTSCCAKTAFVCSGLSIAGIISTVGFSMFPFILPSSTHPSHSLIVWDSSSSHLTLFIMFVATVVFMPIILAYTAWVYRVLRGKVTVKNLKAKDNAAY